MFRAHVLIVRRAKLCYTVSGIITPIGGHPAHRLREDWMECMLFRDGINQILVGISSNPIAVLVQYSGRLLTSVVGSKIENKLLITFSLFC